MKQKNTFVHFGLIQILFLLPGVLTTCATMEQLQSDARFQRFCGCPQKKKTGRDAALGSMEEGALDRVGTQDYLDKMYLGIKRDFEYTGSKFEETADGLQTKGIQLKKRKDDQGNLRELLLSIDGDVSFATGSAALTPKAREILQKIADALVAYPETKIRIGGHTDSVGSFRMNMRLSKARAISVKNELQKMGNVAEERFTEVEGYADTQKVVDTNRAEPLNRRTEIIIGTVKLVM